ncbi:Ubiquitin-like protein [Friedmanniomyces endolithicus]|uniref:Ubiquitin-like protein ATG12 n=2 Tax=Friedmanniomyces endolithicus TaxID=329885 RepID=A0AAN6QSB7_9PEZI|nr:Ubiquitin-like protein [Friedmanniomyces endolithicus]KAK0781871.1 Ubiquitin-like protein [Friedmanniomyces endolithicus]KAK0796090.1 Ubiquitin-like protein [Friedmanniomyces endolithicus]KAK0844681.1 Ubiquitin-like protein [Friedmanniomyces endolithicus]KAK0856117.1 Ubiquitin-like protein [Friedmanniomyces endolithicus]
MASSSGASSPPDTGLDVDVDDNAADMPLTMAASVVLDHLPKDAHRALETAGELEQDKVTIRLSPLPNTPQLRQPRFKCSSNQRFEHIVRFLRKKVGLEDHESVFCYVNSVFSPGLDEGVGNLWRCFKTGNELVVNYSITQAFG